MKISYKNSKLEKVCTNYQSLLRKFNDPNLANDIYIRLGQLHDFAHLRDIKNLRDANLHSLKGSRRYELAIDAQSQKRKGKRGKRRIIFEQVNGENVSDDWLNDKKFESVTHIKLLEISDHYAK